MAAQFILWQPFCLRQLLVPPPPPPPHPPPLCPTLTVAFVKQDLKGLAEGRLGLWSIELGVLLQPQRASHVPCSNDYFPRPLCQSVSQSDRQAGKLGCSHTGCGECSAIEYFIARQTVSSSTGCFALLFFSPLISGTPLGDVTQSMASPQPQAPNRLVLLPVFIHRPPTSLFSCLHLHTGPQQAYSA